MKTFSAKASEVPRKWWVIDARDQVLGQVAVKAANLLRGKEDQKSYMSFSGYVGGHKSENLRERRVRHPELLIERAVRGMIPHNRLGRAIYRKLKVYRGDSHPHSAQQPHVVKLA
jgi:large subunit ribosomal protein L13